MSNPICKADFNGFANYKYVLDNNKNIFWYNTWKSCCCLYVSTTL